MKLAHKFTVAIFLVNLLPQLAFAEQTVPSGEEYSSNAEKMYYQGDLDQARLNLITAIQLDTHKYGDSSTQVAQHYNDLGVVCLAQDKTDEALEYFQKAINIDSAARKSDDPILAMRYHNLGGALFRIGEFSTAEQLFLHALEVMNAVTPIHEDVGEIQNSLGGLYYETGREDQAELAYLAAIAIGEGTDESYYITALNNLGILYHRQGRNEQAGPLLEHSVQLALGKYGKQSGMLNDMMATYINFLLESGRATEVIEPDDLTTAI